MNELETTLILAAIGLFIGLLIKTLTKIRGSTPKAKPETDVGCTSSERV